MTSSLLASRAAGTPTTVRHAASPTTTCATWDGLAGVWIVVAASASSPRCGRRTWASRCATRAARCSVTVSPARPPRSRCWRSCRRCSCARGSVPAALRFLRDRWWWRRLVLVLTGCSPTTGLRLLPQPEELGLLQHRPRRPAAARRPLDLPRARPGGAAARPARVRPRGGGADGRLQGVQLHRLAVRGRVPGVRPADPRGLRLHRLGSLGLGARRRLLLPDPDARPVRLGAGGLQGPPRRLHHAAPRPSTSRSGRTCWPTRRRRTPS